MLSYIVAITLITGLLTTGSFYAKKHIYLTACKDAASQILGALNLPFTQKSIEHGCKLLQSEKQ